MQIIGRSKMNGLDVVRVELNGDILERYGDVDSFDWTMIKCKNNNWYIRTTDMEKEYQKHIRVLKLERISKNI